MIFGNRVILLFGGTMEFKDSLEIGLYYYLEEPWNSKILWK
jgi:hypothetical protein